MAIASLPEFHVTGAIHHFIRTPQLEQIMYLGTAEVTPNIEHRIMRADVFNDIGGTGVPMQRTNQGQMAVIGTLLNRFSKGAIVALKNLSAQPVAAGQEGRFSRGALVFGPSTFELWLLYEFSTNPTFRSDGLELGRYYPQVDVTGINSPRLGTDVEKCLLVMEAYPYWIPQTSTNTVAGTERGWMLYDQSDLGFLQGNSLNVFTPQ